MEPGLQTHVTLYDLGRFPPEAVADGHGADEAEALLDLWTALKSHSQSEEAISLVADGYERSAGTQPGGTDESPHP